MALNLMHEKSRVVFFTEQELQTKPNIIDNIRTDGYEVVVITEQQKAKLETQVLAGGSQVRTVENYVQECNTSFQYKFVEINSLHRKERRIINFTPKIISLVGIPSYRIPQIRISETIRMTIDDTEGVWDSSIPAIVINRSKLNSLIGYIATLLHELGHATTGVPDISRAFEHVLTEYLGKTSALALQK